MTEVVYSSLVDAVVTLRASVHLPHGRGSTDISQQRWATASTPEKAVAEAVELAVAGWHAAVATTLGSYDGDGGQRFYADDEPWLADWSDTFGEDSDDGWTGALIDSVGDTWIPIGPENSSRFESWIVLDRRREVRSYRELSFPVTIAPLQWEMN